MSIAHFQKACQALIQQAVEALASSPHLTQAQRNVRAEAVVSAIMAFLPTEPLQVMLASQAVGHHLGVLDTFQQIHNRALADGISVKMRSISIGETRMMLMLVQELRRVRKEMIAVARSEQEAIDARRMAAPAPVVETPAVEAPAPMPLATPVHAPVPSPVAAAPVTAPVAATPAAPPPPSLADIRMAAETVGDTEFAAHIAAFETALNDMQQTLREADALDAPTAAAASGHLAAITPPGLLTARR